MDAFPKNLLHPVSAKTIPQDGDLARFTFLAIQFAPVSGIGPDGLEFDGVVTLGYIRLPSKNPADLAGQSFDFETRCEITKGVYPGEDNYDCIEGSAYIAHTNAPIYVSRLSFGIPSNGTIRLSVASTWDFAWGGVGLNTFDVNFTVPLILP